MNEVQTNDFESELIIGLVSAVGTENRRLIDLLQEILGYAGYSCKTVKVSRDVIPQLVDVTFSDTDYFDRINQLMDAGNQARSLNGGSNSILARGVASRICAERSKDSSQQSQPMPKHAFIIDSLKRPEEVAELRQIYPFGFVLIGVHEEEIRRRNLLQARQVNAEQIEFLLKRDAEEIAEPHGQRMNKTFHSADFFVQISDSENQLRCDLNRIVELWFGSPFVTPTFDEHAMFMAFASALRSADLSRQVGAVIARNNEILSTGANDCPKSGGGLYWPIRDTKGGCINDMEGGRWKGLHAVRRRFQ